MREGKERVEERGGEGEKEVEKEVLEDEPTEPCAIIGTISGPPHRSESEEDGESWDPDCTECRLVHPDPTPNEMFMYLHALRYKV